MRRETDHDETTPVRHDGERTWRAVFFVLSAAMAAYGLVQLVDGRFAGALGDAGVACLMFSLMPQFPFVRAILARRERDSRADGEADFLQDLERLRARNPWADTLSATGWLLLGFSFLLRALGIA